MEWTPIVFFLIIGAVIVAISYFRHCERVALIKRGVNPHGTQLPRLNVGTRSLLLGLLCSALGLAFIFGGFVMKGDDGDLIFTGFIFLFGGASILGYWKMTEKDRNLTRRMYEARLESFHHEMTPDVKKDESGSDDTFRTQA